ncbi:hypothetical protein G6F57_020247 [Rhizopus arrhizus]|nr:hypothetical protein G6F57_020247 [Rhizopus arrhizus]
MRHLDIDGEVIDLAHRLEGGQVALERRGGVRHAGHRGHHGVGGERRAVVELHALAQLEAQHGGRRGLPGLGQRGRDVELVVVANQRFVHVVQERQVEGAAVGIRIQRIQVARGAPLQRVGGGGPGDGGQRDHCPGGPFEQRLHGCNSPLSIVLKYRFEVAGTGPG